MQQATCITPAGVSLSCLKRGTTRTPLKQKQNQNFPSNQDLGQGPLEPALAKPAMVGWSGILARKMSSCFLNNGKSARFSFLRDLGKMLYNLAPWTFRNFSLARLTLVGASEGILAGKVTILLNRQKHTWVCPYVSPRWSLLPSNLYFLKDLTPSWSILPSCHGSIY